MSIKLTQLKPNPDNPRLIKDKRFDSLVQNVMRYPLFLGMRPLVQKDKIVIAGNMRLKAIKHIAAMSPEDYGNIVHNVLKLDGETNEIWDKVRKDKAIPEEWVKDAAGMDTEQINALIVIDNVSYGENDWENLANNWNHDQLAGWGMDIKGWIPEANPDLLPTDEDDDETRKRQVSFEAGSGGKPSATHDDYSVYEQLLKHEDKITLLEVLNKVKDEESLDTLGDALMYIVRSYKIHNKKK